MFHKVWNVIPYQADQPVNPNLWDSNFCPISLFSVDNYLEEDTKNVTCSVLRMVMFIKQCPLKNRIAKDILQIVEFGFTVWEFLSVIYESDWDKLTANNNNKSFRQCVFV